MNHLSADIVKTNTNTFTLEFPNGNPLSDFSLHIDEYSRLECFRSLDGEKLSCGLQENQNQNGLGPMWSNLLGIGAAKTGTTALFSLLKQHRNITVGDAKRGGTDTCSS
jgi:hypothetical protein